MAQHRAHRSCDVGRCEGGGRGLVQQRLKQVMVGSVDQQNVDTAAGQCACGSNAAKPRTDDDDARLFRTHLHPAICSAPTPP
jgi:hypothetical protein